MGEWKNCTLADLGEIVGGATPSTKNESYYGGDIPWITPKDLSTHQGRYISRGERNITKSGLASCSSRLMPKNSVLFSSRAPIGYIAIAENDICTNQGFKSIIPNAETDYRFLYYLLLFNRDKIEALGSGTTFKEVSGSVMKNVPVSVPPFEEQRRIGQILSALDDKIEENNKINHNLEQTARAVFKSWFVDFEQFGGVMPDDWTEVTLGELCTLITKGTTPTTLKKSFVVNGINFIKAESILENHSIDSNKIAFIDEETNKMLSRSIIKANDILFTIAGTLGRFTIADETLTPANTNQAVAIIRVNSEKISPLTLYSFFIGGLQKEFYNKNVQHAVQANLSLTTIKALPLLLPPKQVLEKYRNIVEPLLKQILNNFTDNQQISNLRDSLLPRLISGELSVDG
ncbi:MAG: restriction endonuclease subunit S [Oscillospiraceae bacterium]|nr:restriction endonuclease subunit S [Oscillospiraceae bacterium]